MHASRACRRAAAGRRRVRTSHLVLAAIACTAAAGLPARTVAATPTPGSAARAAAVTQAASLSLDTFDYSPGPALETNYVMQMVPQATSPTYTASPAANQGANSLRVSFMAASAALYRGAFALSKSSVRVPVSVQSDGIRLAMRSDGAATHTWSVSASVTTADGATYTSAPTGFAISRAAWTAHTIALPAAIPAGSTITSWKLSASVDERTAYPVSDGSYVYFDAVA